MEKLTSANVFKVSIVAWLILVGLCAAYWALRPGPPRAGDCFDPATQLWVESAEGSGNFCRER